MMVKKAKRKTSIHTNDTERFLKKEMD